LKFIGSDKRITTSETLYGNRLDPSLPPVLLGHLYHLEGGGYIVVAASRVWTPIKAYSLNSDFASLPPNFRSALLMEMELQSRADDGRTVLADGGENSRRWDFLLTLDKDRMPLAYTPDTWLVKSRWNQGKPYNRYTPQIDGKNTYTGCVNTAVGQLLRYHRHPGASKGVVSHLWNGQTLKAILYRRYGWDNMPEVLDAATPDYQIDEVARLLADLGIANGTAFGLESSPTSLKTNVLTENFGYSTGLKYLRNTDVDAFFNALKMEIDAERPVLLSFPGHMVIADGYAADGAGRKIHVNMGWGGSYDNFYFLDQPVTAGPYQFDTAAGKLEMYYNIKPCSGADCAVNLEEGDAAAGLTMTGAFNAEKDADLYDLYLKGPTTIRGTRGYGNLAFYIYLYNKADGATVAWLDGNVTANNNISVGNLAAGKYTVKVSLCNESTFCYSPAPGFNQYTVTVTSSTPTDEEKAAIDQSLDVPPVFLTTFKDLVLDGANPATYRILVDARDENGDAVALTVVSGNADAVQVALNDNLLAITPRAGAVKQASRITVRASARDKTVTQTFLVLVTNEKVGIGKTFELSGIFASQDDFRLHKAILDGACTITGYNGYANQAFYTSVQDKGGNTIVTPTNTTINATFTRDLYGIGASLTKTGSYYAYDPGKNDRYVVKVNCPDADERTATIAALLGIDLSSAEKTKGDMDGDGNVTIADAVLAMQFAAGMTPASGAIRTGYTPVSGDVNGDAKIGIPEAIYIIQKLATTR
ncbi:MAG: C10 family peptidase, partial [Syntrophales bacterium]|nr:C10 family peptidase [Syntrophales bacterium]